MCEVAIIDPQEYSEEEAWQAIKTVYEAMGHSLGVAAVFIEDGAFEYDIYKEVVPDEEEVKAFVDGAQDRGAFRLIVHGRLATTGAVNEQNAHPLEIDCPECDVDYVVHNGVLGAQQPARDQHESLGHEYNTPVDSEIIAHDFGRVPTSVDDDDIDYHSQEPCFILMNEEAVFISAPRYLLSEDATMGMYRRWFAPERNEGQQNTVIITPEEDNE